MPNSDEGRVQSSGRAANDAQPLNKIGNKTGGGPERYPPARSDDALEPGGEGRSFEPKVRNETAPEPNDLQGPAGDPAEGKR